MRVFMVEDIIDKLAGAASFAFLIIAAIQLRKKFDLYKIKSNYWFTLFKLYLSSLLIASVFAIIFGILVNASVERMGELAFTFFGFVADSLVSPYVKRLQKKQNQRRLKNETKRN